MTPRINKPQERKTHPALPPEVTSALADFQRRLLALFPNEISQLILFGSYARGEAAPDSDVDVMVVVKWNEERLPGGYWRSSISDSRWQSIIEAATDTLLEAGLEIAPIVIGQERYEEGFSLVHRVRKEGQILWTSPN